MSANQLNHFKLIIFDLDGTLIDAYQPIIDSFNFTMKKLGLPLKNKTVIRKAVGWGDEMLLLPFLPKKKARWIYRWKKKYKRKRQFFSCVLIVS